MGKAKDWTGERLETYVYADVAVEHLHRYAMASMLIEGKVVADIASGEGYGSSILSKTAAKVIGIDIDAKSVALAKGKYKSANLEFREGRADAMPLDDHSIDVLVSFETIEHHDKHEQMFAEIKRVLKPGGVMIMSSPDKKYYTDVPQKNNPFHIKELYLEEFESLTRKHFTHADIYLQKCINGSSVIATVPEFHAVKVFAGDFDGIVQKEFTPLYNIAIASDNPVQKFGLFVFDGEIVTKKIHKASVDYVRNSTSFKLGSRLLSPIIGIKRMLSK